MSVKDMVFGLRHPLRVMAIAGALGLVGCKADGIATGGHASSGPSFPPPTKANVDGRNCEVGDKVKRIVHVNMVALNQSFWYNRIGASQLHGMVYALASDIEYIGSGYDDNGEPNGVPNDYQQLWQDLQMGKSGDYSYFVDKVSIRGDKRPRPIVLRANQHDCLNIHFTNLLSSAPQQLTNYAGVHIQGTEMFSTSKNNPKAIQNDGAFVGKNKNNLAASGQTKQYSLFLPEVGTFLLTSPGDNFSNFFAGQGTFGLFGSLNIQPEGAEYYRSQVSEVAMKAATVGTTSTGQPQIDYFARYDNGKPVLSMLDKVAGVDEEYVLVYTDPTAIVTGKDAGRFNTAKQPTTRPYGDAPQYPQPDEPYREFSIVYHEPVRAEQTFKQFVSSNDPTVANNTFAAGGDFFAFNYGMAGIGPEIFSNRIGVGPMYDCVTCAYEEFFLSSWTVGDPSMIVDIPANFCDDNALSYPTQMPEVPAGTAGATEIDGKWYLNPPSDPVVTQTSTTGCTAKRGPKATKAFYPDDPSNVYHSYMNDHVKMRIHHGAGTLHHLHHLHAHQWLHSPNSDNSHYLDSQLIGPGSSFTLDMVYNGSGNRNQTVGDSIFHCHFYPHFAEGMWSMWRVHDVFEKGTQMDSDGRPVKYARALPDSEIKVGTPIPGLVPLPTIAMAPMPGEVHINNGQIVTPDIEVKQNKDGRYVGFYKEGSKKGQVYNNPGYPFFIPGIAGERAPHPPLDFVIQDGKELNGGLPRHIVYPPHYDIATGGTTETANYDPEIVEYHNKFDFSKFAHVLQGTALPEKGTDIEKVAMGAHATRRHASSTPEGLGDTFVLNGLLQQQGAPYADPCAIEGGSEHLHDPTPVPLSQTRTYEGVDMQMDVVLNKKGWHYSQQRFAVLWQDLMPTLNKERPPEPLFFRANSADCVIYHFANVIPEYYELDDFQVRTPTDVLGQHIHLVKFDVTSSDGGANGWNYEDGTFSPETVDERIKAFNHKNGRLDNWNETLAAVPPYWLCEGLSGKNLGDCKTRAENEWIGAQATVQRWYADPQLNFKGQDRTLRTVFTHDHFSPSTHQQAGLYMGLLIEPEGSEWFDNETGEKMYTRKDGGPTSWAAVIQQPDIGKSYREFMLEFQDFQLAYNKYGLKPMECVEDSRGNLPPMCYPPENKEVNYLTAGADDFNQRIAKYQPSNANITDIESGLNALCLVKGDGSACSNFAAEGKEIQGYVSALRTYTRGYSGYIYPGAAINPPQLQGGQVMPPTLISTTPPFALGTYSVNYRNEPLPLRVWDPKPDSHGAQNQTAGPKGDLAYVYNSIKRADADLNTQQPAKVVQNYLSPAEKAFYKKPQPNLTAGAYGYDPYTPLMRANQGDNVQIRTLVGAHINMHNFSAQGFRWLFEPSYDESGYRSNQPMGISEHFEMMFQVPYSTTVNADDVARAGQPTSIAGCADNGTNKQFADYMYNPTSQVNGLYNGNWGLLRAYQDTGQDNCLKPLPAEATAPVPATPPATCPVDGPKREYNVVAVTASQLPEGTLFYSQDQRVQDDKALLYFGCDTAATSTDPNYQCSVDYLMKTLPSQTRDNHIEPFVLRAAAGECVTVNLYNKFNTDPKVFPGKFAVNNANNQNALLHFRYSSDVSVKNANCTETVYEPKYRCEMEIKPSTQVGLGPQLVSYDINNSNGINLGFNNNQSVPNGQMKSYTWYAGITEDKPDGTRTYTPAEFGSANLLTADPIRQPFQGMLAGMVIEPKGACWSSQDGSLSTCKDARNGSITPVANAKSTITGAQVDVFFEPGQTQGGKAYFREYVIMFQDQLSFLSYQQAVGSSFSNFLNPINYGVASMAANNTNFGTVDGVEQGRARYRDTVATGSNVGKPDKFTLQVACGFSNALGSPYPNQPTGEALGDPETPIYQANPGDPVRFRVMQPSGGDQHVFELYGHVWQEEPYTQASTVIGNNPDSQWQGSRMGVSAADRFDIVLDSAGGTFETPGDYLYRSFPGGDQNYGMWGIFRVGNPDDAYGYTRPLVCVPQYNKNDSSDLQYIYNNEMQDGYGLPSGCRAVSGSNPAMVSCTPQ